MIWDLDRKMLKLYFVRDIEIMSLIEQLALLPYEIQPVYFSDNEEKFPKNNLISNKEKIFLFVEKNKLGFFVQTHNGTVIDITVDSIADYLSLTFYFNYSIESNEVWAIANHLTANKIFFGFACDYEEYLYRNQYVKTFQNNKVSAWVGRDFTAKLPGLYWCTFISQDLIDLHNINVDELPFESQKRINKNNYTVYFFNFFNSFREWKQNAKALDRFCEINEGVFSIRNVHADVAEISNTLDFLDAISKWK